MTTSVPQRSFDQLPPEYRIDDLKSVMARPPWERPPMIFYGVAFHRELVTEWTIKKGLYQRADKDTDYAEHYVRFLTARRQLENMVSCNGRFREVIFDIPVHDTYNEMMVFYSNYARPRDRFAEEQEKAAVELLEKELGLTPEQAQPRWYFSLAL